MGVMFPLLAECRLMFTATIMVDITVVKHSLCVRGLLLWDNGGIVPLILLYLLYGVAASALIMKVLRLYHTSGAVCVYFA